jgi:hypothetical protein
MVEPQVTGLFLRFGIGDGAETGFLVLFGLVTGWRVRVSGRIHPAGHRLHP